MDPVFLKHYERELQFIREMGAEYATEFPRIAGRLGIEGVETSDPYVERLYEGFAFLAARLHMRIDAEYPRFTQNLMNILYPQYLAPTPSMAIVQITPEPQASLEQGCLIPRDTALKGNRREGDQSACEYRSCHDVTLWPVAISEASYFTNMALIKDMPLASYKPKAGLKLTFQSTDEQPLPQGFLDHIKLYLAGHNHLAVRLYEQLFANTCAILACSPSPDENWLEIFTPQHLQQGSLDNQQGMFPDDPRSFSGYRLLREYFAFADHLLFADFTALGKKLNGYQSKTLQLIVLFDRPDPELEQRLSAEDFALFCTPVINLFPKRSDRIHLSTRDEEYHLVVDRTRPLDFEVFQINKVKGYGDQADDQKEFLPFYACYDLTDFPEHSAFYTFRQERRRLSTHQRRHGPRSNYIGSETFVSLVDGREAPENGGFKQLEVHTLCTNRDLPIHMPVGKGSTDFTLDVSAPVASIRCIKGPTKPRPSLAHEQGESAWRLINQLSLNYLSLTDQDNKQGAAALRSILKLYGDQQDPVISKQIDGLRSIQTRQVTRRKPGGGPIAFINGLEITLTFDESAFSGASCFLLGAVLERFFALYVSINSFTQTLVTTQERGEIARWPIRAGQRQVL